MADEWQSVKRREKPKPARREEPAHPSDDVPRFLAEYKTRECQKAERHDWKQCPDFHAKANDRRRNPYTQPYLPDDEWKATAVEKAYHPIIFRTQLCENFIGQRQPCAYGRFCAFAHSKAQVRQPEEYESCFWEKLYPKVPRPKVADFVGVPSAPPNTLEIRKVSPEELKREHRALATGLSLEKLRLEPLEVWALEHLQSSLYQRLLDAVVAEVCTLEICNDGSGTFLVVRGSQAKLRTAMQTIQKRLRPLPKDCATIAEQEYPEETLEKLQARLDQRDGRMLFVGSSETHLVRIDRCTGKKKEQKVQVCVLRGTKTKAEDVLSRISSWLHETGYDEVLRCQACMDNFFKQDGLQCPGAHFLCAACLEDFLDSQLPAISAKEGRVECQICKQELDRRRLAQTCSQHGWTKLQKVIVDAQVSKHVQTLQHEFDERLQQEVDKLKASYGNEAEEVRAEAERYAAEARNKALNLSCPNSRCGQVYADFDGCMALECAKCGQHFCGFCHQPTQTSQGAHDHVRNCDANLTANGSYYASPEIIREAQRRYRVKQLKRFFQEKKFKRRLRNAVVIELNKDLEDIGVDPAALFDFGNLQAQDE